MSISPARTAAFEILLRVERERAYASVLLPLFEENLSANDSALCHELTLGTLRRQMPLDRVIDSLSAGRKIDIEVRIALRLGLYQLQHLTRVPAYSAINESVNLVGRVGKRSAKGFANAVLRRAQREAIDLAFQDETERIAVETSHPEWLIRKWSKDHGGETARVIASTNNIVPEIAFRVIGDRTLAVDKQIAVSRPSETVDGCYLATGNNREVYQLADSGKIYIQDEASQMVAHAMSVPMEGHFLDVCAAPGGKTGLMVEKYANKAVIYAGDLHTTRINLLRANCRRQGADSVHILQYDAERGLPFADRTFEAVLLDAPCSGTGTIRRNPEIRYFIGPADIAELSAKQLRILENASKLVKSGGTVNYSTCSLEIEENEHVCERFLAGSPDFEMAMPGVASRFLTADGFARTWPHRDGMDGFFLASFRRK
ncbi:MAG TPA: 16S rRNA (cytosine(967)-C(5))-methyltransferase RsmB [Pyrinomonadaceae bacterium]|nr:16S rRNA (cytosine(967)-C(5))-methyltransferase RsmB [Pyrinomonadaceae bacterium]